MTRKPNSKGKGVKAPALVHKYNETMGGVDLGDQFSAQYEPQFRSLKLWKKILFNLLMIATVNAYICYKNTFVVQKKMDHLTFQQDIIQGLIGQHREGQTRPGRRCLLQSTRLTARHFIEWISNKKRMRCAVCSGKENRCSGTRIRTWCPDCGVVCLNGKGGLNTTTTYKIYQAYILPRLLYGLEILPLNVTQIGEVTVYIKCESS